MRILQLKLENWRNFLEAEVALQRRVFIVGPNASGKSNFLDAIKFLRDVADEQGGFQRAVHMRGGVSKIRSLHARRYPHIILETLVQVESESPWKYRLEFTQDNQRRPIVQRETVHHGDQCLLDRPDSQDKQDRERMTQTHLEQVNANKAFREVAEFFAKVRYLHIVPQLVREPERSVGKTRDPFGGDFLEQLARTPARTLQSRLDRIQDGLRIAIPQLKQLDLQRDQRGVPHLRGLYEHWRPDAGWQSEDQFSDGTLRLLGLLWVFLDGSAPLLLEEPELSLHPAVVRNLPRIMAKLGGKSGRQVIVSTHSADLLLDPGIASEEVLLLEPAKEGTAARLAASDLQIRRLLEKGVPMGEVVLPRTAPAQSQQLVLFGD